MHISILAVGRLKEKYLVDALQEYLKRLRAYARVEIKEVADQGYNEGISAALEEEVKKKEALRLEKHIKQDTFLVALDREGEELTSGELADWLNSLALRGKSHVTFLIGGSLGLTREIQARADRRLSFSRLTFPHQLMRVLLLEQIYRSFKIIKGEPYHK